jgi:hypothetical protein
MFFEENNKDVVEVSYFAPHGEESHALTLSGEVFRVRLPASAAPTLASPFTPYFLKL